VAVLAGDINRHVQQWLPSRLGSWKLGWQKSRLPRWERVHAKAQVFVCVHMLELAAFPKIIIKKLIHGIHSALHSSVIGEPHLSP
jgi:hypothetical protein